MSSFDPNKAEVLDSKWRGEIEPVDLIIDLIRDLGKKEIAVDVGAGTGYYSIPLSKIFKMVYAIDISFKMAVKLRKKLESLKIDNIGIIVAEKPPDLDFSINLILFANVLHEMEKPEIYLSWARRSEYILIVEWKKIDKSPGPPVNERIGENELVAMLDGFEIKEINTEILPFHYVILARSENN